MSSTGIEPPHDFIEDVRKQKIRPQKPITVYRGLTWHNYTKQTFEEWMGDMGRKVLRVGDRISITDTRVTSWATNICVAAAFAASGNYGVVLKYQVHPDEIMLDTRMLADRKTYYHDDQSEIMLLPGKKLNGEWGGQITREVTVELLS